MIPKKIHYCWFGGTSQPESVRKCIENWKKVCPDYEIICWDESNYDINSNTYIKQAYEAQKWAFVSDYARLDILYHNGGIYLDTDVELLKSPSNLLKNKIFMGLDRICIEGHGEFWVSTGLGFGSEKRNKQLLEFMGLYNDKLFIKADNSLDLTPTPIIITDYLKAKGFVDEDKFQYIDDLIIYPTEYFAPKNFITNDLNITSNTYSIHHYDNSWNKKQTMKYRILKKIKLFIRKLYNG
ncbi:glycosyltransferase family 32 protein [Thomasclavelia cocleata]|uniref:glycosyltransferase family 32 protein n=1 Tax=Thomasclavelia cocleata TaxID=69824 RepID=UPI00241EBE3F|nr:glycosyltransferase [Thomasclavelia cocleata]